MINVRGLVVLSSLFLLVGALVLSRQQATPKPIEIEFSVEGKTYVLKGQPELETRDGRVAYKK